MKRKALIFFAAVCKPPRRAHDIIRRIMSISAHLVILQRSAEMNFSTFHVRIQVPYHTLFSKSVKLSLKAITEAA